MKTFSLTRRLITAVLLVEVCSTVVLIASAGVYEGVSRFHTFDIMLRGRADSMLGAVQDAEDPQDNVMLDGTQSMAPKRDLYAVRDERGRMLGHSENWPDAESAFEDAREFRELTVGHRHYRVLRVAGLRMVDPGDHGGGVPRHVVILYGARTHPVWEAVGKTVLFYALISLALLGVSALAMLRLLRQGLQPLRALAQQAAGVSTDSWEFQPPASVYEVRELAPLASALATALAGLERSFQQQKHFVSDAAHELKTSVTVVKSSLQVLSLRERNAAEYRAGIERAEQDCDRMEELVANMLTLASVDAPENTRVEAAIDPGEMLADTFAHFKSVADLAGVQLILEPMQPALVQGVAEELRLLYSVLLNNALQHTTAGGSVRGAMTMLDDVAVITIKDDGEGIAAETLPHVFDRFYRGDASRSRRTGGTGLGLSIAQGIVHRMKGTIEIASEPGIGTRAIIRLAVARSSSV